MTISKEDATQLAICYQAFIAAPADDQTSVLVWGRMLRDIQNKTGIDLIKRSELNLQIHIAERLVLEIQDRAEAEARRLAGYDPDYSARCIRGRWVVWSAAADHEVEFDTLRSLDTTDLSYASRTR